MNVPTSPNHTIQVTKDEIREVLKDWQNGRKLGEHPLAQLAIVEQRRRAENYDDTPAGRGVALKKVVHQAVATLKPVGIADDDEVWPDDRRVEDDRTRYYIILTEQFFNGRKPAFVQDKLMIERGWYYRKQQEALELLADIILEWEQQIPAMSSAVSATERATIVTEDDTEIDRPPDVASPPDIGDFTGRSEELRYFQAKLHELNYVLITGFPGVGKTALAAKLSREAVAVDKVFWYKCHEGDGADSLIWALASFLANRGRQELWQILKTAIANEREAMPLSMRITYALKLLATDHYLICIDDFQTIDMNTDIVQLASQLYEMTQVNQLKLIITSHRSPAFILQRFEPLKGLTEADTQQLVLARGLTLKPEQLAKLYTNTEGHVLFINLGIDALKETPYQDQLLSTLPEDERIERYLLQAVDQRLSEEERMVMGAVSILGDYTGGRDVIETVLNEGSIRRQLQTLSERNLLTVSLSESGREYSQHAIVRNYYYDNLGLRQRREMHSRAAEYYSTLDSNTLLAITHYTQAREFQQAVDLVSTHTRLLVNQGHARALHILFRQIEIKSLSIERSARFHLAQGEICALLGEGGAARQHYQLALADLRDQPDSTTIFALRGRACRGMGELLQHEEPAEALEWLNRGLDELTGASASEEAALLIKIGSVQIAIGNYDAALKAVEAGQAMLPEMPDQLHISALMNLGAIYSAHGDIQQSMQYTRQGLVLSQQFNFHFTTLGALHNLAIDLHISGDWTNARIYYEEALALAERLGDVHEQVAISNSLGMLYTMQGNKQLALAQLTTALELTRHHQLQEGMAYVLQSLADLQLRQQAWEAAEHSLSKAQEIALSLGIRSLLPEINLGWAQLWLARHDPGTARQYAEEALGLAQELKLEREIGMTYRILGQIYWSEQNEEEAVRTIAQSVVLLDPLDPYETARAKLIWSTYLIVVGQISEGETLQEEAQGILTQLGVSDTAVWQQKT